MIAYIFFIYEYVVRLYVFYSEKGGGAMNLVYGSMFLLRGLCGALCFVCYDWPNRLRFGQCSFVVAFIDGLFINGCSFLRSITLRMSTRRLSVVLFVFSFRVTVISFYLLRGVLWWPRSFCFLPPDGVDIVRLFIVIY